MRRKQRKLRAKAKDKPPDAFTSIISAVTSVVGFFKQKSAQDDAQAAREDAARDRQKSEMIANNRAAGQRRHERMTALAEARRVAAEQELSQSFGGSTGGSGYAGSAGSLQSQLGTNLAYQRTQGGYSNAISQSNMSAAANQSRANEYMTEANTWGAIAGAAGNVFQSVGGFKTLGKSFGMA